MQHDKSSSDVRSSTSTSPASAAATRSKRDVKRHKIFPAVLGSSRAVVDARDSAPPSSTSATDVDMRKLEASFTAKAIADEKHTKEQLASLKRQLKADEDRLYHKMRVAVREGKSKVKKLLKKEVSAETALMAEKKADRLRDQLEQVKLTEAQKEKEIKEQLQGLKSEEKSAIRKADPGILSKAASTPVEEPVEAAQAPPSSGSGWLTLCARRCSHLFGCLFET